MTHVLLRRRKLGRTSCREIKNKSTRDFVVVRNDLGNWPTQDVGFIFRWGCTDQLDTQPHDGVVNNARAIHRVNDKLGFRRVLQDNDKDVPRTWFNLNDYSAANHPLPVVVRPASHAQGRRFHLCETVGAVRAAAGRYPNYYISEYIRKVSEFRVFVVCGRVACVAQKTPGNLNDPAWNVALGGRFDNVRWDEWPLRAVRVAVEAFQLSGLHFGGVDVMVDAAGRAYVVEINSAPSLTSPYRQGCMAKCFDDIVGNGKETIPLIPEPGGYLKFIHPALTNKAKVVAA